MLRAPGAPGSAVAPVDSVGDRIHDGLLASVLSVLTTTYDEQEVRECLSPTFVRSVLALQSALSAGCLTAYEFEEALLKLFTHSADAAELTSTTSLFCKSYRQASCGTGATRYNLKDAEEYCMRHF